MPTRRDTLLGAAAYLSHSTASAAARKAAHAEIGRIIAADWS